MTKFYTSKGDQDKTSQIGIGRISKTHIRIQTIRSQDEVPAALAHVRAYS